MEKFLLRLSDTFARTPNAVLKFKSLVFSGLLVLTALMVLGIYTRTELDMTNESFLNQTDPAMLALNEFRRQFGSDDSVMLVYRAKDDDVFSRNSLLAIQGLTNDLRYWEQLDPANYPESLRGVEVDFAELTHIRRVQSIANLRIQRNEGDTLLSNRLVPAVIPESDHALADIRARALEVEDNLLAFYSADARFGAVMIKTDFGAKPVENYVPAVDVSDVILDDGFVSFDTFSAAESFDPGFDASAEIQEVSFETVNMMDYTAFHVATKAIYQKYSNQFEFYPVGNPPLMEFMLDILSQMQVLGLLMILIFGLLLYILFRSFSAVIWPLVTIALSMTWTWGLTVWFGVTISQMVSLTVLLVFAVGIADCVHVMSGYFSFRRQGKEHHEALSLSYGKTGLAIMITTITTMTGVLALSTSNLQPLQVFGYMSALGVFLAFVFTLVLLPILLDLWHPGAPNAADASLADRIGLRWNSLPTGSKLLIAAVFLAIIFTVLDPWVGAYIALVTLLTYIVVNRQAAILSTIPYLVAHRPWTIMAVFATTFIVCAYGLTQIRIDTNISELTREGSEIRIAYETVDENMAGAMSMMIMIDTKTTDGLYNPQLMQAIDTLQTCINEQYSDRVTRTHSLANIVKDTYQVMSDDNPAYYRVPNDAQMISQLLYLFNSANPEDRRALVSDDYSRSHISLNIYNAGSYEYQQFFTEVSEDIEEVFSPLREEFPELEVYPTGSMALMMRMADEIANSQFSSFSLAFVVISLIMIVTLGSLQGGLLAMVPNLIPALLSFGLMGLLGVPLDSDTILIAPLIIGIAVDDTIHFMTHYRMELIKTGSVSKSLRSTITDVGQAVLFTTMVLGLGFALLSFSDYLGMAKMGFFGSAAIIVALLCDLFLIPAMIMIFKPTFGVKDADTTISFREKLA
ncbi:MAG: MMPL family transporter [Gammaproteobacteria bacterium]|nr:MMPL family transporter [Gammaproteobacteria bacterium]